LKYAAGESVTVGGGYGGVNPWYLYCDLNTVLFKEPSRVGTLSFYQIKPQTDYTLYPSSK
jgi:hypothetical protein